LGGWCSRHSFAQVFSSVFTIKIREDLFSFIERWILPGSIIHTDSHRSYQTLSSLGFTHCQVNHSADGTHTNWIEGIFGSLKKMARKYDAVYSGVENLYRYLSEFCFRYSFSAWNRKKAFLKILFVLEHCLEYLIE
ncbi:putative transposable element, partial [Pseudoloma neurophilia]